MQYIKGGVYDISRSPRWPTKIDHKVLKKIPLLINVACERTLVEKDEKDNSRFAL